MPDKSLLFSKFDHISRSIYQQTLSFPHIHQRAIGDQLRRSSLSIILNIVEGGARKSTKEKHNFLNISFGSLKETKYLWYFAHSLHLIQDTVYIPLMKQLDDGAAFLYSLLYKKT